VRRRSRSGDVIKPSEKEVPAEIDITTRARSGRRRHDASVRTSPRRANRSDKVAKPGVTELE